MRIEGRKLRTTFVRSLRRSRRLDRRGGRHSRVLRFWKVRLLFLSSWMLERADVDRLAALMSEWGTETPATDSQPPHDAFWPMDDMSSGSFPFIFPSWCVLSLSPRWDGC